MSSSWLTRLVKPKIQTKRIKDIPNDLWKQCPKCGTSLFNEDLKNNQDVCVSCDFHFYRSIQERINDIFGSDYKLLPIDSVKDDPLKFQDHSKYSDRLKKYRTLTGRTDSAVALSGSIGGSPVSATILDFSFMGGSMGRYMGNAMIAGLENAKKNNTAFVVFTASGGARMQEGILSLMQMSRVTVAVDEFKSTSKPYIVVLCNPTTGGVTASFAMLGDIQIAEKGATIGFAGARVIEQTIRAPLPEGFQTAEYLEKYGMVDLVSHRKNLKENLSKILNMIS